MPRYDYRCSACGHVFEEFCKIAQRNKPTKKPCPGCKKKNVELQIGMPAIGDSVRMGLTVPDKGFREVMSKIKSKHRDNQLKDRRWGN